MKTELFEILIFTFYKYFAFRKLVSRGRHSFEIKGSWLLNYLILPRYDTINKRRKNRTLYISTVSTQVNISKTLHIVRKTQRVFGIL